MKNRLLLLLLPGILSLGAQPLQPGAAQTQYVFLVTGDGIRHQDLFSGADPDLSLPENRELSGIENVDQFRAGFWDPDLHVRRAKAMPFFWSTVARDGAIFGNRALGSVVEVRNPHRFSYPGYAEILRGSPVDSVDSNSPRWNPRPTLIEHLRQELNLAPSQAPVFGSWEIFNWITMHSEAAVFCNAGYERVGSTLDTARARLFDDLQFSMRTPWDSVRHDTVTLELAMEFLRTEKPKFLYLALGETDDWAHERRYDRMMETLRLFDDALRKLWDFAQSAEPYRGRTTLIVTTDHGRGRTMEDWGSHGAKVEGADEAWLAFLGPDTPPLGEAKGGASLSLSHVAATVLALYGLDHQKFNPLAAPPIKFPLPDR